MKKLIVLVFLVVAGLSSYSQYDFDYYRYNSKYDDPYFYDFFTSNYQWDYNLSHDFGYGGNYDITINKNKIKTYKKYESENDTNEHMSLSYEFNNHGKIIEKNEYSPEGGINEKYLRKYDDDNFITESKIINSKGELKRLYIYKYSPFIHKYWTLKTEDSGAAKDTQIYKDITEYIEYKYNKMIHRYTQKFDSLKKLERVNYKRGGEEIKNRYEYKFYADGSRKETILYNSKGEIKYIWSYDCLPEGKIVNTHKDTTQICFKKEFDKDSNYIYVEQTTDEKNRIIKVINKYNKKRSLIETCRYNEKEQLIYKYIHHSKDNKMAQNTYYYYNRKGELRKRIEYIRKFDDKDNQIEYIYTKYKDKKDKKIIKEREKNEYDDNKNLLCKETYRRGGEELSRKEINKYGDNKNIICTENYKNKKGELLLDYKKEYEYNEKGIKTKSVFIDYKNKDGVLLIHRRTEYKYNEKGFKTESICTYYKKGEVSSIDTERYVFEYFE